MLSVPIKKVYLLAADYNAKLLATDKRFRRSVQLVHEDGTVQFIDSAFLMYYGDDWLLVFSEHHEHTVYHKEDLLFYRQFKRIRGEIEELVVDATTK